MSNLASQLTNLKRRQYFLYLLLFSLATAMIWVALSLVSSQRKTGISPELQRLAVPLNPTLNREVITTLEEKTFYTEEQLNQFPIYKIITNPSGQQVVVTHETDEDVLFAKPSPVPTPSLSPSLLLPAPETSPSAQSATDSAGIEGV